MPEFQVLRKKLEDRFYKKEDKEREPFDLRNRHYLWLVNTRLKEDNFTMKKRYKTNQNRGQKQRFI